MCNFKLNRASWVCFILFSLLTFPSLVSAGDEKKLTFDESLVLGKSYNTELLTRVVGGINVLPGEYKIDIFINERFLTREIISFVELENGWVQPCINKPVWAEAQVDPEYLVKLPKSTANDCAGGYDVTGSELSFKTEQLRLDVSIPQAYITQQPRGYIPAENWESGERAFFINYFTNYYHSENRQANAFSNDSGFIGLNSGFNLGLWRLRNQSSYQYRRVNSGSEGRFRSNRTFISRAVKSLEAELTLGELYTSSNLLGNINFRGAQLKTDNRMLPVSQQGYAPIIKGIAKTTAKVTISQNGQQIYQTTVSAGPFEITDLFATNYRGDLEVKITEADGSSSSFTVPFNAVPNSVRPGQSQFSLSIGKTFDNEIDQYFGDLTYERGLSNTVTMNFGMRLANDYLALSSGGVWNTTFGSLGTTAVYSKVNVPEVDASQTGWRLGLNYSRTFNSGTSITLAGYRYSTEGFRELTDVAYEKRYFANVHEDSPEHYFQKNQVTLSMNQSLNRWGSLSLSGSKRSYRRGFDDDEQYQFSYTKQFGTISFNLNYSRQYVNRESLALSGSQQLSDNMWSLNVSMPLGAGNHIASMGVNRGNGSNGSDYSMSLSGVLDKNRTAHYNIRASQQNSGNSGINSFGASINKRTALANLGGNYSQSDQYTQWGANMSGALVLHSGGLTLGQTVGNTFAIVEASDAEGAQVLNTWGSRIDSHGYALMPNLTPYRNNTVSLTNSDMSDTVELLNSSKSVVPYNGAIVKLTFNTQQGIPALFKVSLPSGKPVPLGATVSVAGENRGMVGQSGLTYVRLPELSGQLAINWGHDQQCISTYQIDANEEYELQKLPLVCRRDK